MGTNRLDCDAGFRFLRQRLKESRYIATLLDAADYRWNHPQSVFGRAARLIREKLSGSPQQRESANRVAIKSPHDHSLDPMEECVRLLARTKTWIGEEWLSCTTRA